MSKRRFGVSLPVDIANDLDELARLMKSDRSSIVAEALRQYIHDYLHYFNTHTCMGILIAVKLKEAGKPSIVIDEFGEIIKNYTHYHFNHLCIEIFLVMGNSRKIVELHARLRKITPHVRYIPLITLVERYV